MRRFLLGPALGLALGIVVFSAQADPPQQGEAQQPFFPITAEAGPWVICAASYIGPDAMELGRQMVQYIQNTKRVSAYLFNQGEKERQELKEQFAKQQQANPLLPQRRRSIRVDDQVAVLVGGYQDKESARRILDDVKKWKPPELRLASGKPAVDMRFVTGDDGLVKDQVPINPFETAFVTRNPKVGQEMTPQFDKAWVDLNRDEKYSLLNCPRTEKPTLTLMVKQYAGAGGLVQSNAPKGFLEKLGGGSKPGDALYAASLQAHELARVLRELNFKAFVLHTRTGSLVTVGGFNGPDDPEYKRVTQQLAALQQRLNATGNDPIRLNPVPAPMFVPR